jgi:hypothetical protein
MSVFILSFFIHPFYMSVFYTVPYCTNCIKKGRIKKNTGSSRYYQCSGSDRFLSGSRSDFEDRNGPNLDLYPHQWQCTGTVELIKKILSWIRMSWLELAKRSGSCLSKIRNTGYYHDVFVSVDVYDGQQVHGADIVVRRTAIRLMAWLMMSVGRGHSRQRGIVYRYVTCHRSDKNQHCGQCCGFRSGQIRTFFQEPDLLFPGIFTEWRIWIILIRIRFRSRIQNLDFLSLLKPNFVLLRILIQKSLFKNYQIFCFNRWADVAARRTSFRLRAWLLTSLQSGRGGIAGSVGYWTGMYQ